MECCGVAHSGRVKQCGVLWCRAGTGGVKQCGVLWSRAGTGGVKQYGVLWSRALRGNELSEAVWSVVESDSAL